MVSEPKIHSPYIYAKKVVEKPKTSVWEVVNKKSDVALGVVRWYGPWRQYCFFPDPHLETVFNKDCLEQIVTFIKAVEYERKQRAAQEEGQDDG